MAVSAQDPTALVQPPAKPKSRRARSGDSKIALALAGAFGGISPNLLFIAVSATQGAIKEISFDVTYLMGLLLFAFLGGSLTLIWGETDLQRAFYLGLGLPSLLQVGIGTAVDAKTRNDPPQMKRSSETQDAGFYLFAAPAFAQAERTPSPTPQQQPVSRPPQEPTGPRKLELHLDSVPQGTTLLLLTADGKVNSGIPVEPFMEDKTLGVNVDKSVTSFRLKVANLESKDYSLEQQPAGTISYEVDIDKNAWRGFLQALGARDVPRFNFEVEKLP